MAVFTGVVVASSVSGAHLNPAVSIGLAVAGKFEWALVPSYILAQMIGAGIGAFLVWVIYHDHYNQSDDPDLKLATFCTSPAIPNIWNNLISEAIGTFVLIFSVLYIEGPNLIAGDNATPAGLGSLGALPVSLIVLVIGLSLGGTTGYAINPARDLAPRIIHQILPIQGKGTSQWSYAWIPIIGPILGTTIAALLYLLLL